MDKPLKARFKVTYKDSPCTGVSYSLCDQSVWSFNPKLSYCLYKTLESWSPFSRKFKTGNFELGLLFLDPARGHQKRSLVWCWWPIWFFGVTHKKDQNSLPPLVFQWPKANLIFLYLYGDDLKNEPFSTGERNLRNKYKLDIFKVI